jgi:DNA-binding PadR family transcriptional regulator
MYTDNTLTPKEAIRLCALGSLALGPVRYGDLAISIRHFISRVIGPTPEVMGHSLELLKYEGLAETIEGSGETALLRITDDGVREMRVLLTANLRPSNTELNTLITALKFRFLHMLSADEQRAQAELLLAAVERELARLQDLREHPTGSEGFLPDWLDHHIAALGGRLEWLACFRDRIAGRG